MTAAEPSDVDLLLAARTDAAAFDVFYRRYAERLHRWLHSETGDASVAMDLTAESFAAALAGLGRFRGDKDGSGAAWLFGIAHNLLRRYIRKQCVEARARKRLGMQLEPYHLDDHESRSPASGHDTAGWSVEGALAELPETQRRAVELRVVDELPYPEIAARLQCSEVNARARVSRGLKRLSARLSEVMSR